MQSSAIREELLAENFDRRLQKAVVEERTSITKDFAAKTAGLRRDLETSEAKTRDQNSRIVDLERQLLEMRGEVARSAEMASKLASSTMSEGGKDGQEKNHAVNFFVEQYNSEKARADETLQQLRQLRIAYASVETRLRRYENSRPSDITRAAISEANAYASFGKEIASARRKERCARSRRTPGILVVKIKVKNEGKAQVKEEEVKASASCS